MLNEVLVPRDAMNTVDPFARNEIYAHAAVVAMQATEVLTSKASEGRAGAFNAAPASEEDDVSGDNRRKRKHATNTAATTGATTGRQRSNSGPRGSAGSHHKKDKDSDGLCRNQTGYIGVRQRKWGMFAAEIRDGDKRRWLGSFSTGREAGMAYDAAAISQKGCKAKTNFQYLDFTSLPRHGAETVDVVRWDLLPKDIAERFPVPTNPNGMAGDDLDSGPVARGRSSGRGVDQQASDPDALDHQDQQPSKRSRSSSYCNAPTTDQHAEAARQSVASYPSHYMPNHYEEDSHHMMGGYYSYAPPGMYPGHPGEEMEDPDYAAAAAAAAYQQHYMMGPPMHPVSGGYEMGPYRDQSGMRKRSSGGMSGAGAGSSSSPRGTMLPQGATARVVASAASRAAAVAAFEGMTSSSHGYAMHYPMHYHPSGYRHPAARGCTGSDGGMRPEPGASYAGRASGGGSRQQSEMGRTSDASGHAGGRRQRASDESLPLASLELDAAAAAGMHPDTGPLHDDVAMEPHRMMMHYADMGPFSGGYDHPPMPHAYHRGPYPLDGPHAPRSSQAGGEAHHPPPMSDYLLPCPDGMLPGYGQGYHPHPHTHAHPMAYGYPPLKEEDPVDGDMDGDETEDLAARWKNLTRGHSQPPMPRHAEEVEALASLHHISMPASGGSSAGAPQAPPGSHRGASAPRMDRAHVLEGANAIVAAAAAAAAAQMRQMNPSHLSGTENSGSALDGAPDAGEER